MAVVLCFSLFLLLIYYNTAAEELQGGLSLCLPEETYTEPSTVESFYLTDGEPAWSPLPVSVREATPRERLERVVKVFLSFFLLICGGFVTALEKLGLREVKVVLVAEVLVEVVVNKDVMEEAGACALLTKHVQQRTC